MTDCAIDPTRALRETENALRDFIEQVLNRRFGSGWEGDCGVSPERLAVWRGRKRDERKRQAAGVVEERLLYYADFYDLGTILKKHWQGEFSDAFGDWRRFEVLLDELLRFRDPDAHRRELLPHQQQLISGISGEIRSRIVRWRSRNENVDDCFPRIESARDSLGNIWTPSSQAYREVITKGVLHPGDPLDFVVIARDPEDSPLEYMMRVSQSDIESSWQSSGVFHLEIKEQHIRKYFQVWLHVRSARTYHASMDYDDWISFEYSVLPTRR